MRNLWLEVVLDVKVKAPTVVSIVNDEEGRTIRQECVWVSRLKFVEPGDVKESCVLLLFVSPQVSCKTLAVRRIFRSWSCAYCVDGNLQTQLERQSEDMTPGVTHLC